MAVRSRFWLVALAAGLLAALMIGLPTVMFPSPFFVRMTPVRTQDYVIWLATAALLGPLIGTYVAPGAAGTVARPPTRTGGDGSGCTVAGGVLSLLAVGCPVCNKVVLLLLGASGALTYFAPLQPLLGLASLALLAFTLVTRLRAVGLARPRSLRAPLTANAVRPSVLRPDVGGRAARFGSGASLAQP